MKTKLVNVDYSTTIMRNGKIYVRSRSSSHKVSSFIGVNIMSNRSFIIGLSCASFFSQLFVFCAGKDLTVDVSNLFSGISLLSLSFAFIVFLLSTKTEQEDLVQETTRRRDIDELYRYVDDIIDRNRLENLTSKYEDLKATASCCKTSFGKK